MDPFVDFLIVGAGPTGLGAAWQLQKRTGSSWLIVDAAAQPGGMAVTEVDEKGFRWDLGGHVIHSHFPVFNEAIACHSDWVHPHRGGWVRVGQRWCPTPIQHNIGHLSCGQRIKDEILNLTPKSTHNIVSNDLDSYYTHTFGPTLHTVFFAPFNFKQWAHPLASLSHTWTSLRSGSVACNVPRPEVSLTLKIVPEDTSSFPYPRLGTGTLWHSIAEYLPADRQRYSTALTRLDLDTHNAILSDGTVIKYRHCISTVPLTTLLEKIPHQRPDLTARSTDLKASSTQVIGFGFQGPLPQVLHGKTWIFSASSSVPFHRATILTNFSPAMSGSEGGEGDDRGAVRWSIMFETSFSSHRPLNLFSTAAAGSDTADLEREILAELDRWGIDEKPISVWRKRLDLGYPVPFLERDGVLATLIPELEKEDVWSRGRFGAWRYESSNQDYAFMQGVDVVDGILSGVSKQTGEGERPMTS